MADESRCRFATKLVVGGKTMVDGVMSVSSIDTIVGKILYDHCVPPIDFRLLYRALTGYHLHYDITVNGTYIALEVSALSDPVVEPKRIEDNRSSK